MEGLSRGLAPSDESLKAPIGVNGVIKPVLGLAYGKGVSSASLNTIAAL